MENKNHLKIVKSLNDDNDKKDVNKERPLSTEELLAKLDTLGTIREREQAVVENLRRKGFDV